MTGTETPRVAALLQTLPKALLHDHLDGSLRVSTLLELCAARGLPTPAPDVPSLQQWFASNAMAGSLERYLEGFGLTVAALASPEALERVAYEVAEDAAADGCVLAEFRMAPLLLEPHGVPPEAALEAMLAGLHRSRLPCGLIVCGMRHETPSQVERAAALALRYAHPSAHRASVIGFDLAGPEFGFPATAHRTALERVRSAGLPITLHAGEADAGIRVLEAVELGAQRIGHGVRFADLLDHADGARALEQLQRQAIHFEVCPTSNVQTGAAASIADHPIRALWNAGLSLSVQPDNRLISCTTLTQEADQLHRHAGFRLADLAQMQAFAIEASFLPDSVKASARTHLQQWHAALPPALAD